MKKTYFQRLEHFKIWAKKSGPIEAQFDEMDARERRCTLLLLAHNYPAEFIWAGDEFADMVEKLNDAETSQRN